MSEAIARLSTEEKRRLLKDRLAAQRALPKTYPASYSQRRLWFMHKLAPESPAYNVEAALPLGVVDVVLLERAINAIVARHAALRTTFVDVDGEPVQTVAPELHVPLEQIDLTALPSSARETRLAEIRRTCATDPFDLATGPLVRTQLVHMAPGKNLFLLNLHHILADGWSMAIFSRELTQIYEAFARGEPSPLDPLPLQYGDFAVWQRREGDGAGFAAETAYWSNRLAGMETLDLPTDHPRPAVQSFAGAFHNAAFSPELTARLETFSRERGATLFMTLLTGFKVLLARLAGQSDVAIGTYIANRERPEIEGLIGFFLNTLVLRTDVPRAATFAEVLQSVRETALGAYTHQALPFERLVEILRPPRDLRRNPLVQVVFQLQNAAEAHAEGSGTLIDYQRSAAAFDLAVTAYQEGGSLKLTFEYATDLFERETVEALARRLEQIFEQAMRAPQTRVAGFEMLLPEELAQLREPASPEQANWMATPVTRLFADALARDAEAPAFYVGEACATIGQVAASADRIAHALVQAGVAKGDVVGVCLPRSVELAASLMAIWQCGAVYLPLDPAYPAVRRQFMLEDSDARVLIVCKGAGEDLAGSFSTINVNAAIGDLSRRAMPFEPVPLSPEDPSHIIYTSGSTGQPKGALAPHRQLLNRLHWMWQRFPHKSGEVEAVKTATSFIDSLWELAGPMIAGRPAAIIDATTLLEPASLVDRLGRYGVTRLWVTPSYLRLLLESVPDLGDRLPRLTNWWITGEKLPAELVGAFRAAAPAARLINLYGTSEAWDICFDTATTTQETDPVPVGLPLDNVGTVILDQDRQRVPDGVPGELYVTGAGLCLGFVKRPDLDEERFVTLASASGPERALSSGDRARRRRDGRIEILGRTDEELKISGMRVHPAEIEACLGAMDKVAAAAATGVTGPDGITRLWAWIKPDGEATIDPAALRAKLARVLPAHMVPERIVAIADIPLTPSGKVDRRALAAQASAQAQRPAPPTRARGGEAERVIAGLFAEALGRPVEAQENFFAAGGHSLLAARALARINDRLSLDLGIRDFFADPTATGLAALAEAARCGAAPKSIQRLARRGDTAVSRP